MNAPVQTHQHPASPSPAVGVPTGNAVKGIGLTAFGYALFAVQDATVKWLVVHYAVPQILFTRSLIIIAIASVIGGRGSFRALAASPNKLALLVRAVLILVAWMSYYSAARSLGLAELTTIYFAAPIIVVALSIVVLKERVDAARWLAVLVGFVGVVVAASPTASLSLAPVGLALFAACCWACSLILARLISRSEKTSHQMLVSNGLFAAACAVMLIWTWRTPDLPGLMLMLLLGVAGGLGQICLFEGFRYAPASAIAPIEYTGLLWAFAYGYLFWSDVPPARVFAGAALIVVASITLIWFERRRSLRGLAPAQAATR